MKKKVIVILLAVLVVVYIGVKGLCFYTYNSGKEFQDYTWEFKKAFDNRETTTIKSKIINNDEEYFYYEGLKIRNDFQELEQSEMGTDSVLFKGNDMSIIISKSLSNEQVTWLKKESKQIGLYYDLSKDLEKNNVNTDLDLYDYIFSNINSKLNLFSSINKIRKTQTINQVAVIMSSNINKFTIISGDYDGYILTRNNMQSIVINHDNDSYSIIISSNSYSQNQLYDLISTIVFE